MGHEKNASYFHLFQTQKKEEIYFVLYVGSRSCYSLTLNIFSKVRTNEQRWKLTF